MQTIPWEVVSSPLSSWHGYPEVKWGQWTEFKHCIHHWPAQHCGLEDSGLGSNPYTAPKLSAPKDMILLPSLLTSS